MQSQSRQAFETSIDEPLGETLPPVFGGDRQVIEITAAAVMAR